LGLLDVVAATRRTDLSVSAGLPGRQVMSYEHPIAVQTEGHGH
jgi:hypothetical protein